MRTLRPHWRALDVFGYSEEQIAGFFLTWGLGAFMLYMVFIVAHLAWESKAGWTGTFWLFLALCLGMVGFSSKFLIQWFLGIE
jgi:hypothetical protein